VLNRLQSSSMWTLWTSSSSSRLSSFKFLAETRKNKKFWVQSAHSSSYNYQNLWKNMGKRQVFNGKKIFYSLSFFFNKQNEITKLYVYFD
jgi:hypothetical protein